MPEFSNVAYNGTFSAPGSGIDPNTGLPFQSTASGQITAVLSEAADGTVTGTYSYAGQFVATTSLGNEEEPISGGGTVSGTEGNLIFTPTSGPIASGNGALSSNDTVLTFNAQWNFDGGSGQAFGSLDGNPAANIINVSSGGAISGSVVLAGEILIVSAGGKTISTVVTSSGEEIVSSGGVASATHVESGGSQVVWGIGFVTNVSGGLDLVQFGGTENSPSVTNGELNILSGGTVSEGQLIGGGAALLIQDGGTDIGTALNGGSEFIDAGGLSDAQAITGAGAFVEGTADNARVNSGGTLTVSSGGMTSSTTITSHGEEIIVAGGVASASFVLSGGQLSISGGGIAAGVLIEGGTVALLGGAVSGAIDFSGGGTLDIGATQMPNNLISGFGFGDVIDLAALSSATSATLKAGNILEIVDGGIAYDLSFDPSQNFSGEQFFLAADPASGTDVTVHRVVSSSQILTVSAFQTSSSVLVDSGGEINVLSGGTTRGTVLAGGTEEIGSFATVSGVTIIASGGAAFGTIVYSGGAQNVEEGSASGTILSGGNQLVEAGGTVTATTIDAGGVQFVGSAPAGRGTAISGFASATTISNGGLQVVADGTAVGTAIDAGGSASVSLRGTISAVTIDGGTLELAAGSTVNGPITFGTGDGTLRIDSTVPTNVISGLAAGDTIDLAAVTSTTGGSVVLTSGNVLVVSEAGSSYDLNLDPTESFDGLRFALSADQSGGTDVEVFSITPPTNPSPPFGTTADMIMSQSSTGNYEVYDIGNNSVLAAYSLMNVSAPWQAVHVGGFNGSDTSDLLLRNSTTGAFELFDVVGNTASTSVSLGAVGTDWSVLGFGDFSSNPGETDMLMRQSGTAKLEVYDISDNQITGAASMGAVGPEWQFLGVGDFSSNPNETDMLTRDVNNGALEVYNISHNAIVSATGMGAVGPEWQFVGVGDFSGNPGETDMLTHNSNTGALEVYNIKNDQIVSANAIGAVGPEWSLVGIGDFSGNPGETDMITRNSNTGAFEIYDISHDSVVSASGIGAVGTDWQSVGIAAYQSTGAATAASGSSLLSSVNLPSSLDPVSAAGLADGGTQGSLQIESLMAPTNTAPGAQLPPPTWTAGTLDPVLGANLLHA